MTWPLVLERDNGIRPAGPADECFYCHQKVGQPHGKECVIVHKVVRYRVKYEGQFVGYFDREDPYFWDSYDCEFHKNESSWCGSNALDDIKWAPLPIAMKAKEHCEENEKDGCACSLLEFEYDSEPNPGPYQSPQQTEEFFNKGREKAQLWGQS